MKPDSRRDPFHGGRALLVFLFAVALSACARHYTLKSTAELPTLPASSGINGGSFDAPTHWSYLGSREESHEFRYYYNRGNMLRSSQVTLPRSAATLDLTEFPYGGAPQWVILDTTASTFHFSLRIQPVGRILLKDLYAPPGQN